MKKKLMYVCEKNQEYLNITNWKKQFNSCIVQKFKYLLFYYSQKKFQIYARKSNYFFDYASKCLNTFVNKESDL